MCMCERLKGTIFFHFFLFVEFKESKQTDVSLNYYCVAACCAHVISRHIMHDFGFSSKTGATKPGKWRRCYRQRWQEGKETHKLKIKGTIIRIIIMCNKQNDVHTNIYVRMQSQGRLYVHTNACSRR